MIRSKNETLALLLMCWSTMLHAQSDLVIRWVDEFGNPAHLIEESGGCLHVSAWLDAITETTTTSMQLTPDSSGFVVWSQAKRGVYTLEALPWEWTVVVEPAEEDLADTITLYWPSRKAERLRGTPARLSYQSGHPGRLFESLDSLISSQLDTLEFDLMVISGAANVTGEEMQNSRANVQKALRLGEDKVEELLTIKSNTMWGDLMESRIREWRMMLGQKAPGRALSNWDFEKDLRSWEEKLLSPGWCANWELENDLWWEPLEKKRVPWRSWVAMGKSQELQEAMGWDLNELHLAMWFGKYESWFRWADAWWELKSDDACEVAKFRKDSERIEREKTVPARWSELAWTFPDGATADGNPGQDDWKVWFVTRNGSATAIRELAILDTWLANHPEDEVSCGVLSVDSSMDDWLQTAESVGPNVDDVRWLNQHPGWWDCLDLMQVPQVIVVRPDGQIQTLHATLPSQGLFAELKRWQLLLK